MIIFAAILLGSCGGGSTSASDQNKETRQLLPVMVPILLMTRIVEGKFTKVDIGATLDASMADAGKKIFDVKCSACHKLTNESWLAGMVSV